MINTVRNTVLAIANKNNYGYISPSDFNLYAAQAQMDIFENYFHKYNHWVVKQNQRMAGAGYADIVKKLEDVIDFFSVSNSLTYSPSGFVLPADFFFLSEVYFGVYRVERVSAHKINSLISSNLTAPAKTYPAYTYVDGKLTVYPLTITTGVRATYIRYPKAPKWTFFSLVGGEPMFDATQGDYQDFELPLEDEPRLIAKICQYVGVEIRESDVYQFGSKEEIMDQQQRS